MSKFTLLNMLWLSLLGFSCGLANYVGSGGGSSNRSNQDSQVQVRGTFTSSQGRLTSKTTCADNDACVELCDSMLDRLSLQEDCYDLKEEEVQGLRDTYNKLVKNGGDLRQLSQVEPEEMQTFLEFSPKLYESAIFGFRRGWKENCTPDLRPDDPRDREDCKLEDYYQQDGYHSEGASQALEWIASSNWLGELLLEHDEDFIVMLALLEILAEGGQYPQESSNDKDQTCQLNIKAGGLCPFDDPGSTEHGRLNLDGTPSTTQSCDWDKDDSSGSSGRRSWPSGTGNPPAVFNDYDDHYKAFGADCLDIGSGRKNYFMIAIEGDNPYSANLGHQVLKEKLCDNSACQRYFYCTVQDEQKGKTAPQSKIINYMKNRDNSIKQFNSDLHTCP